jgi:undecaprenyl-diphosphatase
MVHASLTYPEAIVIGLLQGVTELFPVSSLGHSVLLPAVIGGQWARDLSMSADKSPYLAFVVAVHVATAIALVWFFRADWVRIVRGFLVSVPNSVRHRRIDARNADERLAWLIVVATIPVGITGLAFEHVFRTAFAKPVAASAFLFVNGLILLAGERTRRAAEPAPQMEAAALAGARSGVAVTGGRSADDVAEAYASDVRVSRMPVKDAVGIGSLQIAALFAGISRSGITMVGGLWRGLSHEDSARFAFLLATPVILAAGVLKLPTLFGSAGDHIHGQAAVGFVICGITAYISIRWLVRYFETKRLEPFAVYSLVVGLISFVHFV